MLEKYNGEERVDCEIRRVSQSMRRAVWKILQDVGWCAFAQVGDVVGLVTAIIPSGEDSGRDDGQGIEFMRRCGTIGSRRMMMMMMMIMMMIVITMAMMLKMSKKMMERKRIQKMNLTRN